MTLIFAAAFTMSNLLDALEGGKHNILCLLYILFFAELSIFDRAIAICYNVCESKRKGRQGDCRLSAARCDTYQFYTIILHQKY